MSTTEVLNTEEVWKVIPGYEDYEVSNLGQVRCNKLNESTIIKSCVSTGGYVVVCLKRDDQPWKNRRVHQLVLEAFVGPRPEGLLTRHLNGNPADNRLENLKWGTQKENMADALAHGTLTGPRGQAAGNATLTDDEATEIKYRLLDGAELSELAEEYNVTYEVIQSISTGRAWKTVGPDIRIFKYNIVSEDERSIIVDMFTSGNTPRKISEMLDIPVKTVRNIVNYEKRKGKVA